MFFRTKNLTLTFFATIYQQCCHILLVCVAKLPFFIKKLKNGINGNLATLSGQIWQHFSPFAFENTTNDCFAPKTHMVHILPTNVELFYVSVKNGDLATLSTTIWQSCRLTLLKVPPIDFTSLKTYIVKILGSHIW